MTKLLNNLRRTTLYHMRLYDPSPPAGPVQASITVYATRNKPRRKKAV